MLEILKNVADSNGDWLTLFNTAVLLLAFRDRIFSRLTLGAVDQHVNKVRDLAERIQSDTQFLRGYFSGQGTGAVPIPGKRQ
jgi:hypothetical protein